LEGEVAETVELTEQRCRNEIDYAVYVRLNAMLFNTMEIVQALNKA
jgi:hypothetical protein